MIRRRIAVFVMLLTLSATGVAITGSTAAAEEGGVLRFFNRSKDNQGSSAGPVHMKPNISGAANNGGVGSAVEPKNLNYRKAAQKVVSFEKSVMHEQAEAARIRNGEMALAARDAAEKRAAQEWAKIEAVLAAERQKRALEEAKLAASSQAMKAGVMPPGLDPSIVQLIRQAQQAQLQGAVPGGVMQGGAALQSPLMSSPAMPVNPASEPDKSVAQPEQRPQQSRPRHFFNRQE
ncbi:MAG: hypothetical protein HYS17_03135 [Micavibrio aeruginosavorus]|uniref:Uncharacterized protein n=1 Tax=Micavibrio aeruginosavorus TaxID=349221 RepID=A0A7T5UIK5_9BACT|nr:MAG: hypothetical protein HYS17_03135 [Micavibrio aeruginosavorus]